MMESLLLVIIGIAVLDSLNPTLFITQFLLLATPQPIARTISYISGIVLANFLGGVLILGGFRTIIQAIMAGLSVETLYLLQFGIGLVLLGFGLWLRVDAMQTSNGRQPRRLTLLHTFILGAAVMVNELTTALPYFIALERIAEAQLSLAASFLALGVYNLVFALPLFAFLGLFLLARQRFVTLIDRIKAGIHYWAPRIIKFLALVVGAIMLLNPACYWLSGSPMLG